MNVLVSMGQGGDSIDAVVNAVRVSETGSYDSEYARFETLAGLLTHRLEIPATVVRSCDGDAYIWVEPGSHKKEVERFAVEAGLSVRETTDAYQLF